MTLTDVKALYGTYRAQAQMIEELLEKEHFVAARDVLPLVRESRRELENGLAIYEESLKPQPPEPAPEPVKEEATPPPTEAPPPAEKPKKA